MSVATSLGLPLMLTFFQQLCNDFVCKEDGLQSDRSGRFLLSHPLSSCGTFLLLDKHFLILSREGIEVKMGFLLFPNGQIIISLEAIKRHPSCRCSPENTQFLYYFMMDTKAPSFKVLSTSILLSCITQASVQYVNRGVLPQRIRCLYAPFLCPNTCCRGREQIQSSICFLSSARLLQ